MRTIASLTVLCVPALAQSYVVSPTAYARHEANSSNSFPFTGVFRYQQVHGDLSGTVRVLKGMAWRRDGEQATNTTHVARSLDLEANLADGTFATFGTTFASNFVTAPQQVFTRKLVNLPDWTAQPDAAPAPWTINLPFDTQYPYLGTNDLVWELLVYSSTAAGGYLADAAVPTPAAIQGGFTVAGTGCTTAKGVMKLRATETNNTTTGKLAVNWDITGAPGNAATAVLVGLTDPALPIPGLCGSGDLHTDGLVWVYNANTQFTGTLLTTNLAVPWNPIYTGLLLTAQAASIDPTQGGLGLAISNGVTSEAPPLPVPSLVRRAYATTSTTATNAVASMSPGLVTRFQY